MAQDRHLAGFDLPAFARGEIAFGDVRPVPA